MSSIDQARNKASDDAEVLHQVSSELSSELPSHYLHSEPTNNDSITVSE
jgi:hypothetical protein